MHHTIPVDLKEELVATGKIDWVEGKYLEDACYFSVSGFYPLSWEFMREAL